MSIMTGPTSRSLPVPLSQTAGPEMLPLQPVVSRVQSPAPPPPAPTTPHHTEGRKAEIPHAQAFASLLGVRLPKQKSVLPSSPHLTSAVASPHPPTGPFDPLPFSLVPLLRLLLRPPPRFSAPQNPITTTPAPPPPEEQLPCLLLRAHMVAPASA